MLLMQHPRLIWDTPAPAGEISKCGTPDGVTHSYLAKTLESVPHPLLLIPPACKRVALLVVGGKLNASPNSHPPHFTTVMARLVRATSANLPTGWMRSPGQAGG